MRVYEYSKQYGVPNKELVDLLQKNGFDVQTHMATLTEDALSFLEKHFKKGLEKDISHEKKSVEKFPQEKASIKKESSQGPNADGKASSSVIEKKLEVRSGEILLQPASLSDVASKLEKSANEVIITLLKKGIPCTKNQILSVEIIKDLAQHYGYQVVEPKKVEQKLLRRSGEAIVGKSRPPVIVVVGHVDHGKTTLLDYIRKSRVAAKEKGGITQHIGAYQVNTSHGKLVFLDTPGHEAFTKMRARGVGLADIAILIVAADDGLMPQTVEAIRHAQAVNVPIVVAINKIDKANQAQIEVVKRGLAQYDLLPEEWGGQTVVVPISAKEGENVDQLLELVALQAELLELKADVKANAKGFVLEAKLEKGRGAVATVILHQGMLHVGEYFVAGQAYGKVNSLTNPEGKRLKEVGPSEPVLVSGFDKLPEVGDMLEVVTQSIYKKARASKLTASDLEPKKVVAAGGLNLIIKADNKSSKEAIIGAIEKLSKKSGEEINILHSAVGDISESDISLASHANAFIYGFHVKLAPNALNLAKKESVTVKLFEIIYKLLEDIEESQKKDKEPELALVKIGQAEVRKVFDIKNIGVIAGSYVQEGRFSRNGEVEIWRNNKKVGSGKIASLQRDKKTVKEVHKGFECAFLIDGFNEWEVGDRVDCFLRQPVK